MIHEYPLEGQPPMMTHVYTERGVKLAAAKGAAERILQVCRLGEPEKARITKLVQRLASKGYRVIAVASSLHRQQEFPLVQDDFNWQFEGLLALYDPPKPNIAEVLKEFFRAGSM
jgi:Ca2+-transporting ATPase